MKNDKSFDLLKILFWWINFIFEQLISINRINDELFYERIFDLIKNEISACGTMEKNGKKEIQNFVNNEEWKLLIFEYTNIK